MFLTYFEDNTVYVVYQDLSDESKDISKHILDELQKLDVPIPLQERIKNFFTDNKVLESNFSRQKAYISSLTTYIDVVNDKHHKNVYYLNLHILPKDIDLTYYKVYNAKTIIDKVDQLSLKIFTLYNDLQKKKDEKLKTLQNTTGKTFLDLELSFYLKELNRLYDHLLTYKRSLKDKIICSDKNVGIMIDSLNDLEDNPLKQYQFVKVSHQKELITFVYSLVSFLEEERVNHFKENDLYRKLKNIISKINNYLLKISTSSHIKKEKVSFDTLQLFFNRYKNSKEVIKNTLIYNILELIFQNQLREGLFISKSIDMTKMFEQVVKNSLSVKYEDNLFIGEEPKRITGKIDKDVKYLNSINHLLESKAEDNKLDKEHVGQFPDFLIKEYDVYHIIDAKYKLKDYLIKDRTMFWQVLIYSKLFNKDITNQNTIKKIIVFAEKSEIDLNKVDQIAINSEGAIDIERCDWEYDEMAFNSKIGFIGIRTLNQDLL